MTLRSAAETAVDGRRDSSEPCREKFGTCGSFRIRSPVSYLLVDTLSANRGGLTNLTYEVLAGDTVSASGTAVQLTFAREAVYAINFTLTELGTHVLSIFLGGRQLSNSPFRLFIFQRTCEAGRLASQSGLCLCDTGSSFDVGGLCVPFATLFPSVVLPIVFVALCATLLCFRRRVEAEAESMLSEVKKLRVQLGLLRKNGFVLSNEWYPFWKRPGSIVMLQARHLEAAANLSLNRENFEPRYFDGLTASLLDRPEYFRTMFLWLLDSVCKPLLQTADELVIDEHKPPVRLLRRLSSNIAFRVGGNEIMGAFRRAGSTVANTMPSASFCVKGSTQERRFSYFRRKVTQLQLWRGEDGLILFEELKARVVRPCMEEISRHFDARYELLRVEAGGDVLTSAGGWEEMVGFEGTSSFASCRQDDSAVMRRRTALAEFGILRSKGRISIEPYALLVLCTST
jgi:hypothetical protein